MRIDWSGSAARALSYSCFLRPVRECLVCFLLPQAAVRAIRRHRPKSAIPRLRAPGYFFLNAAQGWLELGNPAEARRELDHIATVMRGHPDVLFLRWEIYARSKSWKRALAVARTLTARAPDDPRAWIALARSVQQTGQVQKAYTTLAGCVVDFPGSWELLADTAAYAHLCGKEREAERYLTLALAVGDPDQVKRRILAQAGLAGFWNRVTQQR